MSQGKTVVNSPSRVLKLKETETHLCTNGNLTKNKNKNHDHDHIVLKGLNPDLKTLCAACT